jgi:hypothetical protein
MFARLWVSQLVTFWTMRRFERQLPPLELAWWCCHQHFDILFITHHNPCSIVKDLFLSDLKTMSVCWVAMLSPPRMLHPTQAGRNQAVSSNAPFFYLLQGAMVIGMYKSWSQTQNWFHKQQSWVCFHLGGTWWNFVFEKKWCCRPEW